MRFLDFLTPSYRFLPFRVAWGNSSRARALSTRVNVFRSVFFLSRLLAFLLSDTERYSCLPTTWWADPIDRSIFSNGPASHATRRKALR